MIIVDQWEDQGCGEQYSSPVIPRQTHNVYTYMCTYAYRSFFNVSVVFFLKDATMLLICLACCSSTEAIF